MNETPPFYTLHLHEITNASSLAFFDNTLFRMIFKIGKSITLSSVNFILVLLALHSPWRQVFPCWARRQELGEEVYVVCVTFDSF